MQIRLDREYVENAVKNYINKRIAEVCKKQGVDDQIALEVEDAVVEVRAREGERLLELEKRVREIEDGIRTGKTKDKKSA